MPKQTTTLSIFLASPSDVANERQIVQKVIDELNHTTLKILNLHLEIVSWENSTYPDFGKYPQDVINQQIDDDYDIFIGILWARFGTPTIKAISGTLEEFERAYTRVQNNEKLKVCFYFKTDPIDLYKIDISQFQKVKEFKEGLSKLGGYHWDFHSSNFEEILRRHLNQICQTWDQQFKQISHTYEKSMIEINNEDDEGFYELFEDMTNLFKNIGNDLSSFNDLTSSHNAMIHHYTKKLDENLNDFKARKKIIDDSSEHMRDYSHKSKIKFDLIQNNFDQAINKFNKFLEIYPELHNDENAEELTIMLNALDETITAIPIMVKGTTSFLDAIKQMPRITTNLNRSKKLMISTIEPFLEYIDGLEMKFTSLQKNGFDLLSSLQN